MLPEDSRKRKRAKVDRQPSVLEHFGPEDHNARPIPYSHKALESAALKWLIGTNQVCDLFFSQRCTNICEHCSQYRCSRIPRSGKCSTSHLEQRTAFNSLHPSSQELILSRCLSGSYACCGTASTYIYIWHVLSPLLTLALSLGPHCEWRSQLDMRCMAGWQR